MTKQIRVLTKDSNQLQTERQRGVQLTIDLTKSKEKEEA
jgi:hypothetical protein